jgi:hypothetical protein
MATASGALVTARRVCAGRITLGVYGAMATVDADGGPSPHTRVEVLGNIGPNWFASVMVTGIVATAILSRRECPRK